MGKKKIILKTTEIKTAFGKTYQTFLNDIKKRIEKARFEALRRVNRQLVKLYWEIGKGIVQRQEQLAWGKSVVERLSTDLRMAFPDMKGLSVQNLWYMRQVYLTYRDFPKLQPLVGEISWTANLIIMSSTQTPEEKEFYLKMVVKERWSKRELQRQINSDLFTRYMSVKKQPEKCLPEKVERGDLLPFKDHYVLEFLGLRSEHTELELRKAILANLRDFFLEFGRNFTFVGEEYPLTVGTDIFHTDLLFFHRELQCLVAVELKIGKFRPEYVGKMGRCDNY